MSDNALYEELGIPTVVNATGTKTRIGGSRIRTEALDAMQEAADTFVRLEDLQAHASGRIAAATGADAGYVTSGAAAGLLLSAAACIAGNDPAVMDRLPDTTGVPDEIIIPRTHRTGYDHALRTAGATLVDIGTNDAYLGTGSRNVEPWEYEAAITEDTVAIAHIYKDYGSPPLADVCDIAHDHNIAVIVDAAAELPPVSNLTWFSDQGADLVAFSGGKSIRGPQTTGILAGRADLIQSAAMQQLDMHAADTVWDPPSDLINRESYRGVPRQGIGRPLKVGKEELVGLLAALDAFMEEDHDAQHAKWQARADRIASALDDHPGVSHCIDSSDKSVAPAVVVHLDTDMNGITPTELVLELRREDPRVFVDADGIDDDKFTVNPMCLTEDETDHLIERLTTHLGGGGT